MPAPKYQLIFDSRQLAPSEHKGLKERLHKRLGLNQTTLVHLFGGQPVVIRRNLNQEQARRFAERMRALEAPCRIEVQMSYAASTHMSDSLVVCPKCQHSQSPVEECSRCGLIFRKYRPGHPEPPVAKTAPADTAPVPEKVSGEAIEESPSPAGPSGKAGRLLAALGSLKARLDTPFLKGRPKGLHSAPPYLQVVINQILKTALTAAIAVVLLIVGMWFARGLWMLYTATQVGERYIAEFPNKAQAIVMVLSQHSLILPLAAILVTLVVCTSVATASQFLHLGRYLYNHRPWWWRLLLWHLPLAAAGGMALHYIGLVPSAKLGGALALMPTLCLAPAAFDLGQALICEAGDLLARLRQLVRLRALLHQPMIQLRNHIASHLNR